VFYVHDEMCESMSVCFVCAPCKVSMCVILWLDVIQSDLYNLTRAGAFLKFKYFLPTALLGQETASSRRASD
jgi:hypothetical protein